MPMKAPSVCPCGYIIASGELCPCGRRQAQQRNARFDAKRPSARARGYDGKWQRERTAYLLTNPTCRRCNTAPATVVHHIVAHKGNRSLFWSRSNWLAVCQPCHDGPLQSQERRQ